MHLWTHVCTDSGVGVIINNLRRIWGLFKIHFPPQFKPKFLEKWRIIKLFTRSLWIIENMGGVHIQIFQQKPSQIDLFQRSKAKKIMLTDYISWIFTSNCSYWCSTYFLCSIYLIVVFQYQKASAYVAESWTPAQNLLAKWSPTDKKKKKKKKKNDFFAFSYFFSFSFSSSFLLLFLSSSFSSAPTLASILTGINTIFNIILSLVDISSKIPPPV